MALLNQEISFRARIGPTARIAAEAVLTLATGLLLARLAWLVAAPDAVPPSGEQFRAAPVGGPPDRYVILTESNPFTGAASSPDFTAAVPTTLDLGLAGLRWAGDSAGSGSAIIILPDGSQKHVRPGQEIVDGAVLDKVGADGVFLRFGGELQLLSRTSRGGPLIESLTPPASVGAIALTRNGQVVSPQDLITDISLSPETRNGLVMGYRLAPRGLGYFETAGLQPGDLIIRVNGKSVEGLRPESLHAALLSSETISLDVVRAGAIVQLRVASQSGLMQ